MHRGLLTIGQLTTLLLKPTDELGQGTEQVNAESRGKPAVNQKLYAKPRATDPHDGFAAGVGNEVAAVWIGRGSAEGCHQGLEPCIRSQPSEGWRVKTLQRDLLGLLEPEMICQLLPANSPGFRGGTNRLHDLCRYCGCHREQSTSFQQFGQPTRR